MKKINVFIRHSIILLIVLILSFCSIGCSSSQQASSQQDKAMSKFVFSGNAVSDNGAVATKIKNILTNNEPILSSIATIYKTEINGKNLDVVMLLNNENNPAENDKESVFGIQKIIYINCINNIFAAFPEVNVVTFYGLGLWVKENRYGNTITTGKPIFYTGMKRDTASKLNIANLKHYFLESQPLPDDIFDFIWVSDSDSLMNRSREGNY